MRRRASVGCAVITSRTSARASSSPSSVGVVPRAARRWITSRRPPRRGAGASALLAPAQAAHALVVLGQVEQLEPARQRADEQLRLVDVQAGDELREAIGRARVAVARVLGERDRALVLRQRRRPLARLDDGGERGVQQRLVVVERPGRHAVHDGGCAAPRVSLADRFDRVSVTSGASPGPICVSAGVADLSVSCA